MNNIHRIYIRTFTKAIYIDKSNDMIELNPSIKDIRRKIYYMILYSYIHL